MGETAAVLRTAGRADLSLVVEIWTDAFAADPFLRWVQPDDAAWPAFAEVWFVLVLEQVLAAGELTVHATDDGAIAWIPPGAPPAPADHAARTRALLVEHGGPRRGADAWATIAAARAGLPTEALWLLRYVGVRRRAQGRGRGRALATPGLRTCDAGGMPAALVSSNPANLGFYRGLGFEVVAECWTADATACLHTMARPGRASDPDGRPSS